jgi:hypothetical protein
LIYGVIYGAIFKYVYTLYMKRNALLGFLLCGLFFNFFVAWFWSSVLTMAWLWLYDIPKHLALLALIYFTVCRRKTPGAETLAGIMRLPARHGFRHASSSPIALRDQATLQNR